MKQEYVFLIILLISKITISQEMAVKAKRDGKIIKGDSGKIYQ